VGWHFFVICLMCDNIGHRFRFSSIDFVLASRYVYCYMYFVLSFIFFDKYIYIYI
jgi:hypothetical protein